MRGSRALAGGAFLFDSKNFSDARGASFEAYDAAMFEDLPEPFQLAQENIIHTNAAGVLRGMHFQVAPHAQAKLVCVLAGAAQFFWLRLNNEAALEQTAHSQILTPGSGLLYTPGECAHGFLSLEPDTVFSLKLSAPVVYEARRVIRFQSGISFDFQKPPRFDLLSERDS